MSKGETHPVSDQVRGLGANEPHVSFIPEERIRAEIDDAFRSHSARLDALVPGAELHHIGSTAIPGALTKGDLDIEVRVAADRFEAAETALGRAYATNPDMRRPGVFAYFFDDSLRFPLGILLTAPDRENDSMRAFRDALTADPALLREYNELKRNSTGREMDVYRAAKTAFIERVLLLPLPPGEGCSRAAGTG